MDAVVVCGSRFSTASEERKHEAMHALAERMAELPDDVVIITGGAPGVDSWAHALALLQNRPTKVIEADWENLGRGAGIIRNGLMLDENPVLVLALWDGESRGTMHTIREAGRRGIPVEVTTR